MRQALSGRAASYEDNGSVSPAMPRFFGILAEAIVVVVFAILVAILTASCCDCGCEECWQSAGGDNPPDYFGRWVGDRGTSFYIGPSRAVYVDAKEELSGGVALRGDSLVFVEFPCATDERELELSGKPKTTKKRVRRGGEKLRCLEADSGERFVETDALSTESWTTGLAGTWNGASGTRLFVRADRYVELDWRGKKLKGALAVTGGVLRVVTCAGVAIKISIKADCTEWGCTGLALAGVKMTLELKGSTTDPHAPPSSGGGGGWD